MFVKKPGLKTEKKLKGETKKRGMKEIWRKEIKANEVGSHA